MTLKQAYFGAAINTVLFCVLAHFLSLEAAMGGSLFALWVAIYSERVSGK